MAADALLLVDLDGAVLGTCDASVGHTFTHSGFSQCWQLMGRKYMYTSGYCPDPPGMGFGPTRTTLFQ